MPPAFKINKDFEWGMLETLTSKNGYTNLAKCELKIKLQAMQDAPPLQLYPASDKFLM